MKLLIFLSILALGISAQANCPDVSGKFGAVCTMANSCDGEHQVYYGFEISQNSCDQVTIGRLSPLGTILTSTYPIGANNRYQRSNIRTTIEYTQSAMVIEQTISDRLFSVVTLQKVKHGQNNVLEMTSASYGAKCQTFARCTIPEL